MNKTKRNAVIAGNWKMNNNREQAATLANELKSLFTDKDGCDAVICVPFTDIEAVGRIISGTNIKLGAQNLHWAEKGAFTGEISADMLYELGVQYVIIGHSERRQYFGETDETVNLRLKAALNAGLTPIVCVGELKDERLGNITQQVVTTQTEGALKDISAADMAKIIIAYEPVWAIGTGLVATNEQADEVCGVIRSIIARLFNNEIAEASVIQYGGSMNPANAEGLLACEHIDGGLIGGASLNAKDFMDIITAAQA